MEVQKVHFGLLLMGIGTPRILFHGTLGIIASYIAVCWGGALLGSSPSRSIFKSYCLIDDIHPSLVIWCRSLKGWMRIRSGNPGL